MNFNAFYLVIALIAGILLLISLLQILKGMVNKQINEQIKAIIPLQSLRKLISVEIKFKK